MKPLFAMEVFDGLRDLVQDVQSVFLRQAFGMVVNHSLQTPTGAELHDKDIRRWIVPFFIVFDVLDNIGLILSLLLATRHSSWKEVWLQNQNVHG